MRRIGIITLHGNDNYGNKLQNYALYKTLSNLGYHVTTLIIDKKTNNSNKLMKNILIKIDNKMRSYLYYLRSINTNRLNNERHKRFLKYSNRFLNEQKYIVYDSDYSMLNEDFDYFITGSDQVFNPSFIKNNEEIYLLSFTTNNKKIAYAASFGVSSLDTKSFNMFKYLLSDFSMISIREYTGKNIIKDLTGFDVPVLIDPTMLLTSEDWVKSITECEGVPKEKYILTYFLGKVRDDKQEFVDNLSSTYNLIVVNLNDIQDKMRYTVNPSEFLDYFYNAKIIITDSFHGSVFSIIFKKPFIVFDRDGMNSRIDTLLTTFNLENRKFDVVMSNKNYFEISYDNVDAIFEIERRKALDFLNNSLRLKENMDLNK